METDRIDHKDEPGEYRDRVRAAVLQLVGSDGRQVADRGELVGDWQVSFVDCEGKLEPIFVYRLRAEGNASIEMAGYPAESGEWRLNYGSTLSLLRWCAPMPDRGIDEPQLDEDRRHLAALPDGRLVAWNGDGSSVLLLSSLAQ